MPLAATLRVEESDAAPLLTLQDQATAFTSSRREPGYGPHVTLAIYDELETSEVRAVAAQLFDGAVAVIFQPAEEGGAGGRAMVEDGLIERFTITEVYGMHNSPGLPVGAFAIRPGPFYAAPLSRDNGRSQWPVQTIGRSEIHCVPVRRMPAP